jgi:hypothetical protein
MVSTAEPLTAAQQLQYEARARYRQSLQNERPLNGAELGSEFGRGERWGQKRIEEVKNSALINHNPYEISEPSAPEALSLPPMTPPNSETETTEEPATKWYQWKARRAARKPAKVPAPPAPKPVRQPVERPANPQRRGASGVAWLAFGLGIIISVSANVGHIWFVSKPSAEALISAMVFAAFWPVALAVAVEVLSRVTWPAAFRWPGLLGTVLVGGVALVVSYRHMNGLLTYFGESTLSAALGPVGVDGLLIVGGFALLAIGETKKRVR